MNSQNIARQGVKHRRVNSSPDQNQRLPRKKVFISGDTWLDALKFMTCPQWMQKRYVSHQINGIAERNILRLPKMILDDAVLSPHGIDSDDEDVETKFEKLQVNKYTIVAFDTIMQEEQSTEWIKNRGFTLDAPVDIPPENALLDSHEWTQNLDSSVNLLIFGTAQEKIPLSEEEKRFPWFDMCNTQFLKPVMYYAQFNPVLNQHSWDYLAQFLKLLYHPTSYIKWMFLSGPVNQNFIDSLQYNVNHVDNGPRYIQCGLFTLQEITDRNVDHYEEWLVQNVRAEKIDISWFGENLALLPNFVFASGAKQCASKEIELYTCHAGIHLIELLIQKFRTIPLIESNIPTLLCFQKKSKKLTALLGPNLIARDVDSEGAEALYMISNGENRMRISFRWKKKRWDEFVTCKVRIYSV